MKNTKQSKRLSDSELDVIRLKLQKKTCSPQDKCLLVQDMAYHQCSWPEMATILGVTRQHIEENYRDVLNVATVMFKHDIRRIQCSSALQGNAVMMIWLGKQHLGQGESPQLEISKDKFDELIACFSTSKKQLSPPALSKFTAS